MTTFTSLATISIEEKSFIGGTYTELTFDVFTPSGSPIDISTFSYAWSMSPYGQPEVATIYKTGIFDVSNVDKNRFTVYLYSYDTVGVFGKYVQQPILVGNPGYEYRLGQGYINIIPASSMETGAYIGEATSISGSITSFIAAVSASQLAFMQEVSASQVIFIETSASSQAAYQAETSGSLILFQQETSASIATFEAEVSASAAALTFVIGDAISTSAGASASAVVSASALGHSNYGKRTVCVPLNTSASLTTADINYVRIPSYMNNWVLIDAQASCSSSPSGGVTGGSPVFTVSRISASAATSTAVSLLSTAITIDEGEYDSSTAIVPSVISTTGSKVLSGDKVKVANTTSSSPVIFAQISLTFQNLP